MKQQPRRELNFGTKFIQQLSKKELTKSNSQNEVRISV